MARILFHPVTKFLMNTTLLKMFSFYRATTSHQKSQELESIYNNQLGHYFVQRGKRLI